MNPVRTLARPLLASVFVSGGVDMLRNAPALAPAAEPVTSKVVDAAQPVADRAAEAAGPAIGTAAEKVVDLAEQASDTLPDAAQRVADQAADAARPLTPSADEALVAGSQPRSTPPRVDLPADPELLTQINGGVMVGAGLLLAIGKLPRLSAAALAATLIPTTLAGHRFWEIEDDAERATQQMSFMKNVGLLGGLALAAIDTEGRPGLAWRARHASRSARREGALARAKVAGALPG